MATSMNKTISFNPPLSITSGLSTKSNDTKTISKVRSGGILLIGSTGSGKSALGNFLMNPNEEAIFKNQYFKVAIANRPQTKYVKTGTIELSSYNKQTGDHVIHNEQLTIIDTPGLNESHTHDLKYMIQIIEKLHSETDGIQACILVVKFDSKIDAQYKATVQYYRKLLPILFERNVMVVMTDYATDERSQLQRELAGIDVDEIRENTINEIKKSARLSFDPKVFMIDCFPMDDKERELNLQVRRAILRRIRSQKSVNIRDLKVVKTPGLSTESNGQRQQQDEPKAWLQGGILLIGSTGSGKSALGNFLINPNEEAIFDNQYFKVAKANLPQTQNVKTGTIVLSKHKSKWHDYIDPIGDHVIHNEQLTIIDTPGLNESHTHDLKYMIQIIEKLYSETEGIQACIFVVKFSSKIDAQYKSTVQYYRKLLPSLFERNVMVVMTDYATDERSQRQRKRAGIDVAEIHENTIKEIKESAGLAFDPIVFMIDCFPMNDKERELNLHVRRAILRRIRSQKSVNIQDLKVAKTPFLKEEDNRKIESLEGEIEGYKIRLGEVNERAKQALDEIKSKKNEISEVVQELPSLQRELKEKDSDDEVEVGGWSVSEEYKILRWFSKTFDVSSAYKFLRVDRWTNGYCKWEDYDVDYKERRVTGKVQGEFMRGIYAHIKLQSDMRTKYADRIGELEEKVDNIESRKIRMTEQLKDIKNNHKIYKEEIENLMKFIEERQVTINKLAADYMSLEEARERLKAMAKYLH